MKILTDYFLQHIENHKPVLQNVQALSLQDGVETGFRITDGGVDAGN